MTTPCCCAAAPMAPTTPAAEPPHAGLGLLADLRGTWSGEGTATYPTMEPTAYSETVDFVAAPGKPFLAYTQRTTVTSGGSILHTEAGYLRAISPSEVELVVAQPTGVTEILAGPLVATANGAKAELRSLGVGLTPSAKEVLATTRTLWWDEDELGYEVAMAAVGHPLTHHLSARLTRS